MKASWRFLNIFFLSATDTSNKIVDFGRFGSNKSSIDIDEIEEEIAEFFAMAIRESGAKFANVNANWLLNIFSSSFISGIPASSFGHCILSLVNLHPCIRLLEMPNLEELKIWSSRSAVNVKPYEDWRNGRPEWPKLRLIEITIDSKTTRSAFEYQSLPQIANNRPAQFASCPAADIFKFLFEGAKYLCMYDLRISWMDETLMCLPKPVSCVVSACPNLRKLYLCKWMGKNKDLIKFWRGFPGLEEVTLDTCKGLSNGAFVGTEENMKCPVFLHLRSKDELDSYKIFLSVLSSKHV